MGKVIVSSMAWLDATDWTLAQIAKVKSQLMIKPKKTSRHDTEEKLAPIEMFVQRNERIGVPREYYMRVRSLTDVPEYQVSPGRRWSVDPVTSVVLRDDQPYCVEAVMERLKPPFGGAIFEAPTGWGKSFACLEIARRIGLQAVIIVPTTKIRDGWLVAAKEYFQGQIRVGIIQEDRYDADADILVAMIGSILNRPDLPCYETAGLVIGDEVDQLGGRKWSEVIPRFNGPYRVGCSARARRKDGCDRLFLDNIGPKTYKASIRRMTAHVYQRRTGWRPIHTPSFDPEKVTDTTLIRMMCGSVRRNEMIVDDIVKAAEAGRKIIVFSLKRNHLDKLREIWAQKRPAGKTEGFIRGNMSKRDLLITDKCDVLFATYGFVNRGYDNKDIDTVVLATPIGDPEQAIGRGMRFKEGKKEVMVLDYVEEYPACFARKFNARCQVMRSIGCELPADRKTK